MPPRPIRHDLTNELRDRIFEIVGEHEKTDHDGEPCVGNRTGLIAWLCHSIGVRDFEKLAEMVAEYDVDHELHHAREERATS